MPSSEPFHNHPSLSGSDALTLLEIIHGSLSCSTEDDFHSLFPRLQSLFPFDFSLAVLGFHEAGRGLVETGYCNISFPEEWLREYNSRRYLQMDSIVLENFTTYRVQNWPVARKALHRKKEITSLGMDFGLRECCTHGSGPTSAFRTGSMFCFAGPVMEGGPRIKAILDHLVPHLHLALSRINGGNRTETADFSLSRREREVLDWLKQGKSSWDISVILGISERTANFHALNIMRKLGTANRAQAVAVAARLGLIQLD